MPSIEIRPFSELAEDIRGIVAAIEQLDRVRRDGRTAALLRSARLFLGDVDTYFEAEGDIPTPMPEQSPIEALIETSTHAMDLANQVCASVGGPGASALVRYSGLLRNAAVIFEQEQRRHAAEVLRQLELPHHQLRALLAAEVA
jgi:hypothetical protein